jgi:hypothetical protein
MRSVRLLLLAAIIAMMSACYTSGTGTGAYATTSPYGAGYTWIDGQWIWSGTQWTWREGYWAYAGPPSMWYAPSGYHDHYAYTYPHVPHHQHAYTQSSSSHHIGGGTHIGGSHGGSHHHGHH